jgi:structural hemagglutinin/hemolysin toxin protein RtxA
MKKITVTIPEAHLDAVKDAMFDAGGGQYEHYERQSWQVLGEAQFQPMKGATPFIGKIGKLEKVREYKVEMYCESKLIKKVVAAMLKTHPYEGPQYEVYSIENNLKLKGKK